MDMEITPGRFQEWTIESREGLPRTLSDRFRLSKPRPVNLAIWPTETLGSLQSLPAEIRANVILHLDVPSLENFRQVNKLALLSVNSIPQYKLVREWCSDIIRHIIDIEARFFEFQTLYMALLEPNCAMCGACGGYLYLITCIRVCYHCLVGSTLLEPVDDGDLTLVINYLRRGIKIPTALLTLNGSEERRLRLLKQLETNWLELKKLEPKELPYIRSVDSDSKYGYSHSLWPYPGRVILYDRGSSDFTSNFDFTREFNLENFRRGRVVEETSPTPRTMAMADVSGAGGRRFLVTVAAPHLEPSSQKASCLRYCKGCQYQEGTLLARLPASHCYFKQFTLEAFIDHVRDRGPLVKGRREGGIPALRHVLPGW
ncbi:hypothetical protein F4777DRAFT_596152 [Nemania sp. FL0916]|nr:hypothetical protein F4777DRAFT_596152 [Nemania sp. FL0916]